MLKLSIIIPVYNVEKYIRNCLESCVNQDLNADEYEIIVVNDGTPDKSIEVVYDFIKETSTQNIRVVNRENGGLSAARNTGFKEAKGEYVWFVDSDDWIEANVLKRLTEYAFQNELDVLCFNLQLAFSDGRKQKYSVSYEENGKIYKGEDFICKIGMPPAAWVALYRKEYLLKNKLCFYEGILHEDQEFTPRAYCLAKRISFVDDVVYNYNQREGGIMKSKQNTRRCKDLLTVADSLYNFAEDCLKGNRAARNAMLNKVSFAMSQSLVYFDGSYFNLSEYTHKPYYPLYINNQLSFKEKLKYRLMNLSLCLYLKIYHRISK